MHVNHLGNLMKCGSRFSKSGAGPEETLILKRTASHTKTVSYAMFKRSTIHTNEGSIYVENLSAEEGRSRLGLWRDNMQ